jgi:hypothetical protein
VLLLQQLRDRPALINDRPEPFSDQVLFLSSQVGLLDAYAILLLCLRQPALM